MERERLFELIRKEEILLFVGAGFSMYAGYPSGKELAKIMHSNLTPSQQNEITLSSDLLQVTEDIYNLKNGNKNYLIEILKGVFQKKPTSKQTHEILAKIPQIKTIITTNYDELFEITNDKLQVVRRSSDYVTINSKNQSLFKIHGDLKDIGNIILTKSDYNNFFIENKEETIFWNAVKDKLAANHILFIGYSLEDSNVMVMFERILKELGDSRKELFFVAPSVSSSKRKFLDRRGIDFIESTGENLITEIFEDLKLNYLPELSKGNGSADTALRFANSNEINLQISKIDESIRIENVSSLKGIGKTKIKINLELPDDIKDKILDSLNGKNFEDVILDAKIIKDYNHFFNDIRISNGDDIKRLFLKKFPSIYGDFEFIFNDGFELDNYKMEIFIINPEENKSQIKIKFIDFILNINLVFNDDNTQFNIEVLPNKLISSVKSSLNFYNIISRITNNQTFKLFRDGKLFYNYNKNIQFTGDEFGAKDLIDYFQKLKRIEQHFNIKFININLEETNKNVAEELIAFIEKRGLKVKFFGFTFDYLNRKEIELLLETSNGEKVFTVSENNKSTHFLHGLSFETGYLNQFILDGYIANREDLINEKSLKVELRSKSDYIQILYSDEKDAFKT